MLAVYLWILFGFTCAGTVVGFITHCVSQFGEMNDWNIAVRHSTAMFSVFFLLGLLWPLAPLALVVALGYGVFTLARAVKHGKFDYS